MQTITDESGRCVYVIGRLNNIDEQVKEKERLRLKAERDSLTHILNAETSQQTSGSRNWKPGRRPGRVDSIGHRSF